ATRVPRDAIQRMASEHGETASASSDEVSDIPSRRGYFGRSTSRALYSARRLSDEEVRRPAKLENDCPRAACRQRYADSPTGGQTDCLRRHGALPAARPSRELHPD